MSSEPDATAQELEYRKRLSEVTNQINSANSTQEILTSMPDKIVELLDCERLTIYALDTRNQQLLSMKVVGEIKEQIRIPKSHASIAGFAALSRKPVNIADAYDEQALSNLHPNLRFDRRWDEQTGFKTRSVLAVPIPFEKYLLGVMQLINKSGGGEFDRRDQESAEEIARILGIAFYNQRRAKSQTPATKYSALIDKGILTEKQLETATSQARINHQDLSQTLVESHGVPKAELGKSLAAFYGTEFFSYDGARRMPEDIVRRGTSDIWKKYVCAPIMRDGGRLIIAIDDPHDLTRLDAVRATTLSPRYEFWVGLKDDILAYVADSYDEEVEEDVGPVSELAETIASLGEGEVEIEEEEEEPEEDEIDETDKGIVRLANQLILDAHRRGASDIHIEPYGSDHPCLIRIRVDGQCQNYHQIPGPHRNAIVQRFKIMAQLDISERRKPQDGKIRFRHPKGVIELRVATLPTANRNEDVVMRILADSKPMPLEEMGFTPENLRNFQEVMSKPYGIALVVGPTGSGKTTTLHSAMRLINTPEKKIWTAEDPVEITQHGLRQVQMHPKIGLTFAAAMRSFLRADPDVIMVGEMRDHETAAIGIEASLTGHLVLSTLHTNSAPETITRLLDMDIDPFNFADALLGILAQRLVRTLCKECKEPYHPDKDEFDEIVAAYGEQWFPLTNIEYTDDLQLHRAVGCQVCNDTGYKGRMAVHELLVGTDEIKEAIARKAPVDELRELAMEQGMTTLLQDGLKKAFAGHTDTTQVRAIAIK